MKLYSTSVTSTGGRTGHSFSDDGRLDVILSIPKAIGGDDGPGTNPEQLFAAGYGACFDSALRLVARRERIDLAADSRMTAEVGLIPLEGRRFGLTVTLTGHFPGLAPELGRALMHAAHQVCPYSNATRGNIPVELRLGAADGTIETLAVATGEAHAA
jgi:osmotically inducible protein OsmC